MVALTLRAELLVIGAAVLLHFAYRYFYDAVLAPSPAAPLPTTAPPRPVDREAAAGGDAKVAAAHGGGVSAGARSADNDVAASGEKEEEVVEVTEYLSSACEGPPARIWHLRPAAPGTCLTLQPRMRTPIKGGGGRETLADRVLHGRVSCAELRRGSVEICRDSTCDASTCQRVGVTGEGQCGFSFAGFAAATWRCVPAATVSELPPT
eukprot:TRINITY_DN17521_c0_g1_i1.p3 TRINITY_DN17521_c0_g1~~TRINITY_DN17521_c0_g1_i1.p3  ORF type:complete len:208 (-),score=47.52 TRINITY_DN17521_c0_g1_i1:159-782(-)